MASVRESPGRPQGARARAWCRVDLAGGTLDIWPLGVLHRGARTVNVAIDLPVEVELRLSGGGFAVEQGGTSFRAATAIELGREPTTDLIGLILEELAAPPVHVRVTSGSPRGGGLGASSALAVGLIASVEALLDRPPSSPSRVSALARDLEARLMGLPTGRQDQYPPLLGGALEILYAVGGEQVRPLDCDLDALGRSLIVAYTGRSHFSAGKNWEVIRRRLDGEAESIAHFDGICKAATRAAAALESGDLAAVGAAMSDEWSHRRRLADGVSTPEIERLLAVAAVHGAWGGKATGAGGGGCIAVLAPGERKKFVAEAIGDAGARVLLTAPACEPLEVVRL